MQKKKRYHRIKFSPSAIRRAIELCRSRVKAETENALGCSVSIDSEEWEFDNIEEFLAAYNKEGVDFARVSLAWDEGLERLRFTLSLTIVGAARHTSVEVGHATRAMIDKIFSIFEEAPTEDKINIASVKEKPNLTIFIGHGRDNQWEKLKAHLQDKHDLEIMAYETGARAGHTIRDILESMAEEASFALLVLTGEDKTETGVRARQNVIHECGLFQGRLGFDRAIMLVEEGIELASNFDGIQQLRFEKGRVSEVFGDVVSTIRREFGPI